MNKITYFPEYKYVDFGVSGEVIGGWIRAELTDENIEKYKKQFKNTDFCYTAARYANENDVKNADLPQIRGIEIDLDASFDEASKDDFSAALKEANLLLGFFTHVFQLRNSEIRFFYSGSRSIHVSIAPEILGIEPCTNLHRYIGQVIHLISNHLGLELVDESMYSVRRMWRVSNTKHHKTNRYKVELNVAELNSTIDEIKKISEENRLPLYDNVEYEKNEDAAREFNAWFQKAKKLVDDSVPTPMSDEQLNLLKENNDDFDCIKDLCANGIRKKDTYNLGEMVLVAYLKDKGLTTQQMCNDPRVLSFIKNTDKQLTSKNENTRKQNFITVANCMSNDNRHFSCACIKNLGTKDSPIKCSPKCKLNILSNKKPVIYVNSGDLYKQTMLAWDGIEKANAKDTYLFSFGSLPFRIEFDEDCRPFLRELDANRMRYELDLIIDWKKKVSKKDGDGVSEEKDSDAYPPMPIVNNILSTRERTLPILNRVTETPIYAKDGTLNTKIGYNEKTKIYFSNRKKLVFKETSKTPSEEEVVKARSLVEEIVADFPFINDSEKAHAIALMIQPFVRELIDGATPLYLIEKSTPGTGSTLLAEAISHISTGANPNLLNEGHDTDEWRKRITAVLRTSPQMVLIDNVKDRIDAASLSSVLTLSTWEDRILGSSENIRLPIRCSWVATGNNPALSNEIMRRTIRIRLNAKTAEPWRRNLSQFKHPNLIKWIDSNRADIIASIYTLVNNWMAQGRPTGDGVLGKYESWAEVIGGILKVNNIPGFLGNLDEFYASSDADGANYMSFISAWYDKYGNTPVTTAQLYEIANSDESAMYMGRGSEEHTKKIYLGNAIKKLLDKYFPVTDVNEKNVTVCVKSAGKYNRATKWQLFDTGKTKEEQQVTPTLDDLDITDIISDVASDEPKPQSELFTQEVE